MASSDTRHDNGHVVRADPDERLRMKSRNQVARSQQMSAGLAGNWWLVAARGVGALGFSIGVIALPPQALASLVLAFSAFVAADGILAILSGVRAIRRSYRWTELILEGASNLVIAAIVLVVPGLAIIPFLQMTSAWAGLTGALLLAAARWLVDGYSRWLLVISGALSIGWGALEAAVGPTSDAATTSARLWIAAYALPFGLALLGLSWSLRSSGMRASQPL